MLHYKMSDMKDLLFLQILYRSWQANYGN